MAEFKERRLRNKLYMATHIKSGRVFRIQGDPALHYWSAYEEIKVGKNGVTLKEPRYENTRVMSKQSKKKLYKLLLAWMKQGPRQIVYVPAYTGQGWQDVPIEFDVVYDFDPPVALRIHEQGDNRVIYVDGVGNKFEVAKNKEGWYARNYRGKADEYIVFAQLKFKDAVNELAFSLRGSTSVTRLLNANYVDLFIERLPVGDFFVKATLDNGAEWSATIVRKLSVQEYVENEIAAWERLDLKLRDIEWKGLVSPIFETESVQGSALNIVF